MKQTNLLMKTFLLCALLAGSIGAWADYSSSTVGTTTTLTWDFAEFTTTSVTNPDNYNYQSIYFKGGTDNETLTKGGFRINGNTGSGTRNASYTPGYNGTITVYAKANGSSNSRYALIATKQSAISAAPTVGSNNCVAVSKDLNGSDADKDHFSVSLTSGTTYYIEAYQGITITKIVYEYTVDSSSEPTLTIVSPTTGTVAIGGTVQLTGSFTGGSFTGEWVSDNEGVATVSSTGLVTGVAAGTANITYQWTENQSEDAYKATATITVLEGFNASNYDFIKQYDFTSMGNVAFTLEASSAGNIWNQANSRNMAVYFCTNTGLENLAVQAAYGEDSGNSGTYMRGWKIVSGSGLLEGNGAGRCAAIGGIKSGWVVEFNYTGNNFYTKNDGSDAGISKTLLWAESGKNIYRANADGMIGFELDKNNYIKSIKIYQTKIPNPTAIIGGGATWDFTSAAKQTAAGTISVGSNTLLATDGSSSIIYYTNNSSCKWNNDGNGYYLYGSGKTSNSNGRFFILQISSDGVLSLTTTGNNGTYTIKKCANASTSWDNGTDLTTITTADNGIAVSGEIEYDAENPYLLVGFPDSKLNTQKIKWEPNTITINTTNNMDGWRSFYDDNQSYTVDDATKVYIATAKDESTVTISEIEDIPAGTPVILKTSDANCTMILTKAASTTSSVSGNLLEVSTAGQNLSSGNIYRLGYGDEGVGFYPWSAASALAGIVYINTAANNSSRSLSIVFDDETTGVSASLINREDGIMNHEMYDLQGRKVANPVKGLYIVNGKKVIIK